MASSQRPRMSLPPELGDIDDGWGDDEQPTIARPSRFPTTPTRANIPDEFPTAPGAPIDIELADEDEDDIQDRVTSVPEVPLDDYARRAMASDAPAAGTEAPPPPRAFHPNHFELEQSRNTETSPQRIAPTERQIDTRHVSEMPTAPPPEGFNQHRINVPRPASIEAFSLDPSRAETNPPPAFFEKSEDPVFSGRFSSAPHGGGSPHQTMKDKFAMGDFSGALELADSILRTAPRDTEAQSLAAKCREVLQDMYASRISGMERVPQVVMSPDQIRWLSLDHRAGFMLSMIDGVSSVDDLLDVSGMQRLDALRILCGLLDQKVISLN